MRGSLLLMTLFVVVPACSKTVGAPDARPPSVKPGGLSAGDPALVQVVRQVIEHCQVSPTGRVSGCPDDEDTEHRKQERAVGVGAVLMTYCHAGADDDGRVRALAAAGLSRLAYRRSLAGARDPALLDCLLDLLRAPRERQVVRPLARATTYLAASLAQEQRLLLLLDRSKLPEVTRAGYGALWEAGRMRELSTLTRVIRDPKRALAVRVAAVDGLTLGPAPDADERGPVCHLLGPLLTGRELPLAAASARAAAESCPALGDRVLEAARERLQRAELDTAFVSAVRGVELGSRERRPQVLALLTRIVEHTGLDGATRGAALSKLSWIDRRLAVRLARKLTPAKESTSGSIATAGELQQSVEYLLRGEPGR